MPEVSPTDPPGSGATDTVVVMSYNIHHGVGTDGVLDLDRIADTIRSSGADVIGLQEVDRHFARRSGFVDQTAHLAEALGSDSAFGANIERDPIEPGAPTRQYGNAILSRYPIEHWTNTWLPTRAGDERRGLLEATVDVRGVRLHVCATHLQPNSRRSRRAQVDAIRAALKAATDPVVLLGDMNARPCSREIRSLTLDLLDAWSHFGTGAGHTHPTRRPVVRIDYILVSDHMRIDSASVVDSNGSDHLPVVATLGLPESQ